MYDEVYDKISRGPFIASPLRAFVPLLLLATALSAGSIEATLDAKAPVLEAHAIARIDTPFGVEFRPAIAGDLKDAKLSFTDLPTEGVYCLRFKMESGVVQGWDATVPPSDYEEEQPLEVASRNTILKKLAAGSASEFADQVLVLDVQGNIQNAAVLVTKLRTRPFVGGGYRPGECVWRVERRLWEFPDEHTWVPNQDLPLYAVQRRRLFPKDYQQLSIIYARHLGGIRLDEQKPHRDLGTIVVPSPGPGIHAVGPDGDPTMPFLIKPGLDPRINQNRPKGDGADGGQS